MVTRKTGRSRGVKRGKKNLTTKPLVLIVCEGEKTEPNYLKDLLSSKGYPRDQVRVFTSKECGGTDPKTLVQSAKRLRRQLKADEELIYDEIWCVFDRDQHDRNNFSSAIDQARGNDYNLAISNPCFELWFLIHFQAQTAHIERDDAVRKLEDHIRRYNKSMRGVYERLLGFQRDACRRAEDLRTKHLGDGRPLYSNPSTGVDKLVENLNTLKTRRR